MSSLAQLGLQEGTVSKSEIWHHSNQICAYLISERPAKKRAHTASVALVVVCRLHLVLYPPPSSPFFLPLPPFTKNNTHQARDFSLEIGVVCLIGTPTSSYRTETPIITATFPLLYKRPANKNFRVVFTAIALSPASFLIDQRYLKTLKIQRFSCYHPNHLFARHYRPKSFINL
ncbi:hypothetical protein G9A89_018452 [Geosiphon pyriformis]|nr:hypothetical protein G9A89_018452 [Geosiphon pyriformis]